MVVATIMLAMTVSFLLFGARLETMVPEALHLARSRPWLIAALVVLLLTGDAVLPVPSSVVAAFAGAVIGFAYGTVAVWTGLMLGCVVGYWLGRAIARPVSTASGQSGNGPAFEQAGLLMLAATRSIPILAETGIVAAGATGMGFGRVLLVTAAANLLVAVVYVGAGALLVSIDSALAAIVATAVATTAWGLWLVRRRQARRQPRAGEAAAGRHALRS